MIYNLLLNAVDASANVSSIEVSFEVTAEEYILKLSDRASGMPFIPDPSCISLVPTAKRFGTGLGISFAFKVCDALGGCLTFVARPSRGTIIAIELPITKLTCII